MQPFWTGLTRLTFLSLAINVACLACASQTLTFKTEGTATISSVSLLNLNEEIERLGTTPLTIALKDDRLQAYKFIQNGKEPLFWVIADKLGDQNEVFIKLRDQQSSQIESPRENACNQSTTNRSMRLIMAAYKALIDQEYEIALGLAEQATKIDPQLSAPLLIRGMALLPQGKIEEAQKAFAQAKAIDPDDPEIDSLMRSTDLGR
jgi:tetratricopeptide (TPR) repeat protein